MTAAATAAAVATGLGGSQAAPIPRPFSFTTPISMGQVSLIVRDLDIVAQFYRRVIGLTDIARTDNTLTLGAHGEPLLKLIHNPDATPDTGRSAGLFHTAFLLPSRQDLAQWVAHIAQERIPIQGASDHNVSEAFYLADPEGNGIEVYADRDEKSWTWQNGLVTMVTEPLDINGLLASVVAPAWAGAPAGTGVGHVHLRVGDIAPAEKFYNGLLGLDIVARYGSAATFYSSGGYHHHIATNVWQSRGAGERGRNEAGLAEVEFLVKDRTLWTSLADRLAQSGLVLVDRDGGVVIPDPWGTTLFLRSV